jgi:hypothetical protein
MKLLIALLLISLSTATQMANGQCANGCLMPPLPAPPVPMSQSTAPPNACGHVQLVPQNVPPQVCSPAATLSIRVQLRERIKRIREARKATRATNCN